MRIESRESPAIVWGFFFVYRKVDGDRYIQLEPGRVMRDDVITPSERRGESWAIWLILH